MFKNVDTNRSYLTTPEAAERSGLTRVYLALLLRQGMLEGFRRGRDWFVYADSLEAFLTTPRKSGPKGPRKPSSGKHTHSANSQSADTLEKYQTRLEEIWKTLSQSRRILHMAYDLYYASNAESTREA